MISRFSSYNKSPNDRRQWPIDIDLEGVYKFLDELKLKVQSEEIVLESVSESFKSSPEEYGVTEVTFRFVEAKVSD